MKKALDFRLPCWHLGFFAVFFSLDWAYSREDAAGKTVGNELARIGWIGDEEVGERKMAAFFELHIEQGLFLKMKE